MRKLYSKFFLGLVATVCSYASMAQISVTATAGTTGPTTYTTLKGAFDAINAGTHQGAISISVTASTSETAKDSLVASGTGAASYTSVLIKPATGTTPTISGSVTGNLILLYGADKVVIDGSNTAGGTTKNLTIENTNTSGNTIVLTNSAASDTIKNVVIKGASSGSSVVLMGLANSSLSTANDNNLFLNNDITKSSGGTPAAGIFNIGTSGKPNSNNTYRNNRIFEFAAYGVIDGTGSTTSPNGFSANSLFEGNEIYNTSTQTGSLYGMFIANPLGYANNMVVSKNWIHDLNTTTTASQSLVVGILIYDGNAITVTNNMVSIANGSTTALGIYDDASTGAVIKVQYNTVSISGTVTGTIESYAFLKDYTSTGDDVRDNIFVNTRVNSGTGGQYATANVSSTGTMTSNYNDLVSVGNANNFVGANAANDFATLANWQTGVTQDANSVSVAPVFTSATNLHLNTTSNGSLDNKGTPITGITTDFDGDTRSTSTPDVGADEFTNASTCSNPVITTQPAALTRCLGTSATFTVAATGTSLAYQWRKGGTNISGAVAATYTIASVAAGDQANYDVVVSSGTCSTTSTAVALTVSGPCTAVPDVNSDITSVMMTPNVVRDVANVRVTVAKAMKISWNIVDAQGKVVMMLNSNVMPGKNDIALYVGQLSNGTYQLKGTSSKGVTSTIRFVKM